MFYKVILECHQGGAGSTFEHTKYIEESGLSELLSRIRSMPRVRKKNLGGIKLLKEITRDEYFMALRANTNETNERRAPSIYEMRDPNDYWRIK